MCQKFINWPPKSRGQILVKATFGLNSLALARAHTKTIFCTANSDCLTISTLSKPSSAASLIAIGKVLTCSDVQATGSIQCHGWPCSKNSEQRYSPAQDAVMCVHSRIAEIGFEPGNAVVARLLVCSQQIGFLLDRGGYIISEMRRPTGTSVRIFPREQARKCGSPNDEVVQAIGNFHAVQDALFHITSGLRETIFPMKSHFPNNGLPYLPPFPELPPPLRSRPNAASPGSYSSPVGPYHGTDRTQPMYHQPAFSHGMDHMCPPNFDRVPYPYVSERPGHGHTFDWPPSPSSWGPQAGSSGNYRGVNAASGYTARNGLLVGGNHALILTSAAVEVVIPQAYMPHVYGENNGNLGHIRQISGANVVVNELKLGLQKVWL